MRWWTGERWWGEVKPAPPAEPWPARVTRTPRAGTGVRKGWLLLLVLVIGVLSLFMWLDMFFR